MLRLSIIFTLFFTYTVQATDLTWSVKSVFNNFSNITKNLKSIKPKSINNIVDVVTYKSSAIKKIKNSNINEELVFYDYTDKKNENKKKSEIGFKAPELGESKDYVFDYSQKDSDLCSFKRESKLSHVSTVKLAVDGVAINGEKEALKNFEVSFYDDRDEFITSSNDGWATVGGNEILSRSQTERQIRLFSTGYIPLSLKLNLSFEEEEVLLPLFKKEDLDFFLAENEIAIYEGLLLVSSSDDIERIDIDKRYKKKIHLSDNFKIVDDNGAFILFAGVELGNTEIIIENLDGTIIKNIIHLKMDEMSFLNFEQGAVKRFNVEICQKELLATQNRILSISGSKIELFNNELEADKVNVNRYQFTRSANKHYQKDYLIFKHLSEDILVSNNGSNYVEMPSQSYFEYLLESFSFNNNGCTVQFNLSNVIDEIKVQAYTSVGFLSYEMTTLDSHGMFDAMPGMDTEKLFITGDSEGAFYTKLLYKNGSTDYIESFCGQGTYSIEQL